MPHAGTAVTGQSAAIRNDAATTGNSPSPQCDPQLADTGQPPTDRGINLRLTLPAIAAVLIAGVVTAGCSTPTPSNPTTTGAPVQPTTTGAASQVPKNTNRAVEYQVEGAAPSVAITYSTFTGGKLGALTVSDAKLPWKQSTEVPAEFKEAGLMASTGMTNGDVTCRIVSAGKVLAEHHASGTLAVASCTATF